MGIRCQSLSGTTDDSSSFGEALTDCQIEEMVVKKVTKVYDQRPDAKKLIDLLHLDRRSVLDKETMFSLID